MLAVGGAGGVRPALKPAEIPVDLGLGRLAYLLNLLSAFMLWSLAHELAMQVAAMPSTSYVDRSEVDHDEARPPEEVCLLEQSYIRDPSRTVQDLVVEVAAKVGENVRIKRFARFALGE